MESNGFNILDLKEALSRNIKELYKYTGISAYNFDNIIEKVLNNINKMYSRNNNESINDLFKKNVNVYMGKYIRERLIYDNNIISSYVNNTEIDINDTESCANCLEEISKIYAISFYNPSYIMINSLLNVSASKKLNEILSNFCSSLKEYKNFPDSIKTMVEVYTDKNNIDLISLIINDKEIKFDKIKELSEKVNSGNNKYLFELISLKKSIVDCLFAMFDQIDRNELEELFTQAIQNYNGDKPKGGLLLNNIRKQLRKNNKSYEFEEFINKYDKHIEFASIDDFALPLSVLKKGIYKYLKGTDDTIIEKVINELPPKYLIILHNAYGKSLRYINYNQNLVLSSQKRLSVVLITIRDYIKYKNNEMEIIPESVNSEEKVDSTVFYHNIGFTEALQNLKDAGYDGTFSRLDELERVVVMLKMGVINNSEYSNEEIATFLKIDEKEIPSILIKYLNIYREDIISNIDNTLKEYKKIKK